MSVRIIINTVETHIVVVLDLSSRVASRVVIIVVQPVNLTPLIEIISQQVLTS